MINFILQLSPVFWFWFNSAIAIMLIAASLLIVRKNPPNSFDYKNFYAASVIMMAFIFVMNAGRISIELQVMEIHPGTIYQSTFASDMGFFIVILYSMVFGAFLYLAGMLKKNEQISSYRYL